MKIAKLLNEPERKMHKIITELESLSGYRSEDVRLIGEMNKAVRTKISTLGLDPNDTTSEELYEALKVKLAQDIAHLERAWNISGINSGQRVFEVLEQVVPNDEVLAIRCAAIKRLMKIQIPKKTMKRLGYRSIDSMVKREDIRSLLALALSEEGAQWKFKFAHMVSLLKSSDYEFREIKFLPSKTNTTGHIPLMAAVCVSVDSPRPAGQVLTALEAAAELSAESHYLSANHFSKDFSKIAERVFSGHLLVASEIAGETFITPSEHFKLHHPKQAHEDFTKLHPALTWWTDTAHLAHNAEGIVSLHISDCLANLNNKLDFESREVHRFSAALKLSLLGQYHNYESVKNYLNSSIDDTFISLESISAKELAPAYEQTYS